MKWCGYAALAAVVMVLPQLAFSQGIAEQIRGLHGTLDDLYNKMLPLYGKLIDVGRAIAGFAATFYIGYRVWKNIANAEPIDFFPLVRPFVLGFCIINFNLVLSVLQNVLKPLETGTRKMMDDGNKAVAALLEKRNEEMKKSRAYRMYVGENGLGSRDAWLEYTDPKAFKEGEDFFDSIGNDISFAMDKAYYNLKNWFKELIAFLLQLLYEAAALCINTIRTFNLLVLAILGPIVFGLAVFDGFNHTLTVWLSRFINVYLWLPVSYILGSIMAKIQEEIIKMEIKQNQQFGDTFFTTSDIGYLVFMIIGIVAYTTIPNIANQIIHVGGGSAVTEKITRIAHKTPGTVTTIAGGTLAAGAAGVGMVADAMGDANLMLSKGTSGHGTASGYFADKVKGK